MAVSHRDSLRDGAAIGMRVQADVAVAQLPIAGIEVDAMERLPLRRLELAPPARAPHPGERAGVGSQLGPGRGRSARAGDRGTTA